MTMSQYWPVHSAGTMALARLKERACFVAEIVMYSPKIELWWTRDGMETGTALFSATNCPEIIVMMESPAQAGTFTNAGRWGDALAGEVPSAEEQWMWETEIDTVWRTRIWLGGPATSTGSTAGFQGRKAFVFAMNTGV